MTISGSDPNLSRSAPPHEEQYNFPDAQGGGAQRTQLNIGNQSAIDQAIEGHPLGGKAYGRDETKASPQLTPPLWKFRASLGYQEETENTAAEERARALGALMPPEMMKDPAFTDFIKLFAWAESALEKAAAPFDPASVAAANTESAHEKIQQSIMETVSQGNTIVKGGKSFLEEVGAGYPQFDLLLRTLNETDVLLGKLGAFTSLYENGLLKGEEKEKVNDLLRQLANLSSSMEGARSTEELQMLKPLVKEMALTGQLLMADQGSQLALLTTTMMLQGKESPLSLIGPNLSKLLSSFTRTESPLSSSLLTIGMAAFLTVGAALLGAKEGGQGGH